MTSNPLLVVSMHTSLSEQVLSHEIKMSSQQPNTKNKTLCLVKIASGEGIIVHVSDLCSTQHQKENVASQPEIISVVKCQALLRTSLIQLLREGFLLGKISLSSQKALKRHAPASGEGLCFSIITSANTREGTLFHCHIQISEERSFATSVNRFW